MFWLFQGFKNYPLGECLNAKPSNTLGIPLKFSNCPWAGFITGYELAAKTTLQHALWNCPDMPTYCSKINACSSLINFHFRLLKQWLYDNFIAFDNTWQENLIRTKMLSLNMKDASMVLEFNSKKFNVECVIVWASFYFYFIFSTIKIIQALHYTNITL